MSLSLTERVTSLFRKQSPQRDEVGNSVIINPADSAVGQAGQTIIQPLVIKIQPEIPPVVLDEFGQIIPPEPRQKYSKILSDSSIINPGSNPGQQTARNVIESSGVFPLRDHPLPKIIKRLTGK